jgi:hypothetical protein
MTKIMACFAAIAAAFFLAGCDTAPNYPVTYQIPIGFSQVATVYGVQNVNVSATHDSTVVPGVPFFFQISSPVGLTLYVFDKTGTGPGGVLLSQMQGTNITSSATATSSTMEFVFSTAQAYTGGTVQLTVSDHALPPTTTVIAMAPTSTQSTTTVTTSAPTPVAAPGSMTTTTVTTPVAPPPTTPVMNQTQGP